MRHLVRYAGSERVPVDRETFFKLVLLLEIKEGQQHGQTMWEIAGELGVPFERVSEVILWGLRK